MAVEQPWSALVGLFLTLFVQMDKPFSSPDRGTVSGSVGIFQSGGAFTGQRALIIESSPMSGHGLDPEPTTNVSKKVWLKFPVLVPSRSRNTDQRRYP